MHLHRFVDKINLSYHLSRHLIGQNHTKKHHRTFGFFIMMFGYSLSKLHMMEIDAVHWIIELAGHYFIGTGLIPFLHEIENPKSTNNETGTN